MITTLTLLIAALLGMKIGLFLLEKSKLSKHTVTVYSVEEFLAGKDLEDSQWDAYAIVATILILPSGFYLLSRFGELLIFLGIIG